MLILSAVFTAFHIWKIFIKSHLKMIALCSHRTRDGIYLSVAYTFTHCHRSKWIGIERDTHLYKQRNTSRSYTRKLSLLAVADDIRAINPRGLDAIVRSLKTISMRGSIIRAGNIVRRLHEQQRQVLRAKQPYSDWTLALEHTHRVKSHLLLV